MKLNAIIKSILMLILVLTFILPPTAVFASQPVNVTIDGERVNFTGQQPALVDGRTLVPVRGVFEQLGFDVEWNGALQRVTLTRPGQTVILTIGQASFTAVTNFTTDHQLDVPAQIINGSTMLPIRAVIEAVGYNLAWDSATQTVQIIRTQPEPRQSPQEEGPPKGNSCCFD